MGQWLRKTSRRITSALMLAALGACGGGGGGGGSSNNAILSFSPSTVTANVASGQSATLTVRATARDSSLFSSGTLYVYVVDPKQVVTQTVNIAPINETAVSATLYTSPTLAAGRYQGSWQIQLCRDSACSSQVAGSPVSLPYDITVAAAPLQATATTTTAATVSQGGSLSQQVTVQVNGGAGTWTASADAAWLQVQGGSGNGSGSFSVAYLPAALAQGHHSATVTVSSSDGQRSSVAFSIEVLAPSFVLNSGVPSFAAINGAPIAAQSLDFAIDNGVATAWQARSSTNWMTLSPASGMTPASLALQPDPSIGRLASGSYSADITLSAAGIASKTVTAQLALSAPTLSAPVTAITLGGPKGRDLAASQGTVISLNTGTKRWPFAMSALPAWASTTTASGNVDQAGTTISLAPVASAITPGSQTATVTLSASVNGDTAQLPLTLNLNADQRRLLASQWGVGLSSTPLGSVLSRTLKISDNFGSGTLAWTATSSAAWLTVTPGGTAGGSLTLTANPATLGDGAVSTATITVSSGTAGVAPATIRVALWKSASAPGTIASLSQNYTQIVADTIRPYIYANNGGSTVDVYNAYAATKIATISGMGSALAKMSVSPDGSTLYALDTAARQIARADLGQLSALSPWALDQAVSGTTTLLATRTNGVDLVMVGDGSVYRGGSKLSLAGRYGASIASLDGSAIFNAAARNDVDFSEVSGGMLYAADPVYMDMRTRGGDVVFTASPDGSRVYFAAGGGTADNGYRCGIVDGKTGSFIGALPGGDAYPNNVAVTIDGRAICGISGWYSEYDFWVHTPAGALIRGFKFAGYARAMKSGQMVVTPDGLMVAALTDDPQIVFVAIGP